MLTLQEYVKKVGWETARGTWLKSQRKYRAKLNRGLKLAEKNAQRAYDNLLEQQRKLKIAQNAVARYDRYCKNPDYCVAAKVVQETKATAKQLGF